MEENWGHLSLPDELSLLIFSHIDTKHTVLSVGLVCKCWADLCKDERLWQIYCNKKWNGLKNLGITEWRGYFKDRLKFDQLPAALCETSSEDKSQSSYCFQTTNPFFQDPSPLRKGCQLFKEGHIAQAVLALEAEIQRHPLETEAWVLLARAYSENDQDQIAIQCYSQVVRIDQRHQHALLELGICLYNGQDDCAHNCFNAWFSNSKYSHIVPPTSNLLDKVKHALQDDPSDVDLHVLHGTLNIMENPSLAAEDFKWAVSRRPDDYTLLNRYGAALAESHQYSTALKVYEKALKLRPTFVKCLVNVGIAHLPHSKEAALHYFTQALLVCPTSTHILNIIKNTALGQEIEENLSWLKAHFIMKDPPAPPSLDDEQWEDYQDEPQQVGMGGFFKPLDQQQNAVEYLHEKQQQDLQTKLQQDFNASEKQEAKEKGSQTALDHQIPPKRTYSLMELMEMVKEGKTPDDVRQIDDKPPNPNAPVPKGARTAPLKPWERTKTSEAISSNTLQINKPNSAEHSPLSFSTSSSTSSSSISSTTASSTTSLPSPSSLAASSSSSASSAALQTTLSAPLSLPSVQPVANRPESPVKPLGWLPIFTVDAFTSNAFSGNPAAVCLLNAGMGLSDARLKNIAREMNLSETAFVEPYPSEGKGPMPTYKNAPAFRLRWFTPTTEVHLCGHATLAAAQVLFSEVGLARPSITFKTLSGDLIVQRIADPANPQASPVLQMDFPQGNPTLVALPEPILGQLLSALTLEETDLVVTHPDDEGQASPRPHIHICHFTKKLFIEINSVARLKQLNPDSSKLLAIQFPEGLPIRGVSVMVQGGKEDRTKRPNLSAASFYGQSHSSSEHLEGFERYDFVSRYFTPWNGIYEDPVNGSSHTALAVLWSKILGKTKMLAYQASARGGEIGVELKEQAQRVLLSGTAVTVLGGRLRAY